MKRYLQILCISIGSVLLLLLLLHQPVKMMLSNMLYPKAPSVQMSSVQEKEAYVLQKGDYIILGRYQGEPILWQVIGTEKGKPLLLSEHVLCFKSFDVSNINSVGSSNWESSTLRIWLNSEEQAVSWEDSIPGETQAYYGKNTYDKEPGFLHTSNFSQEEKELLCRKDGVFLLSRSQYQEYLTVEARKKSPTATVASKEKSRFLPSNPYVWYWTSSPISTNESSVTAVTYTGGFYKALASDDLMGVCPAVYLQTQNVTILQGTGTGQKETPFYILPEEFGA